MKAIFLSFYIVIMTVAAIPTFYNLFHSNEQVVTLDAGGSDEQWNFLKDYAQLIQYADGLGYKLTAGELYRTMYQQRKYVRDGLSWTFNSYHLKRKACDVNLFINNRLTYSKEGYYMLGQFWESLDPHNRSGIRFGDNPHFERMDRIRTQKEERRGF